MNDVSYAQAAQELEAILLELEGDRLDVDQVVLRVERAGQLIKFCRDKVANAKIAVERLGADVRAEV